MMKNFKLKFSEYLKNISRSKSFGRFVLIVMNCILLHIGLNPVLNFWFWTRFSCCLKYKSEDNFTDFREAVSLEKIFEIVQENNLKSSKLISLLGKKKSKIKPECQTLSCCYATWCFCCIFVWFFILKLDQNKEINLLSSSRAF